MRARCVFEKFTEDSDPIQDMGIGMLPELEKKYRWVVPEAKDIMRIRDIQRKAAGNSRREETLAKTMCKLITTREKAYRRYLAAKREGGANWEVTRIFLERAFELNQMLLK